MAVPIIQMPITHTGSAHGGSTPLCYRDCDLHPQRFHVMLGNRRRRKFLYEVEQSVMEIFGTDTDPIQQENE